MKKGKFFIIGIVFVLIVLIIGALIYKYKDSSNKNALSITDSDNIITLEVGMHNKKVYKTDNFLLSINTYSDTYDNKNTSVIVKINSKVIESSNFFANKINVFSINSFYVIDFINDMSQCENHEIIILNKDGELVKKFSNKIDNWLSPFPTPILSKIESDNSLKEVNLYYKSCFECSEGDLIGFKYTYKLDKYFSLINTEDIVC